jgi:hypothetical protein
MFSSGRMSDASFKQNLLIESWPTKAAIEKVGSPQVFREVQLDKQLKVARLWSHMRPLKKSSISL